MNTVNYVDLSDKIMSRNVRLSRSTDEYMRSKTMPPYLSKMSRERLRISRAMETAMLGTSLRDSARNENMREHKHEWCYQTIAKPRWIWAHVKKRMTGGRRGFYNGDKERQNNHSIVHQRIDYCERPFSNNECNGA